MYLGKEGTYIVGGMSWSRKILRPSPTLLFPVFWARWSWGRWLYMPLWLLWLLLLVGRPGCHPGLFILFSSMVWIWLTFMDMRCDGPCCCWQCRKWNWC